MATLLPSTNGGMKWTLVIASSAARELRRVPFPDLRRIDLAFREICSDPYSGDVKSLRGANGALRRRVGDWRILFDVYQKRRLVLVLSVRRRSSKTY